MLAIDGTYLDGASTDSVPATLTTDGQTLSLRTPDGSESLDVERVKISDRLGSTPRQISWGARARFVTRENDQVDELVQTLGLNNRGAWIAGLESKNTIAITATLAALGFAVLFAVFGVPSIARTVALQAPTGISDQLAESTMVTIDQILDPSQLSNARQEELTDYFNSYAAIDRLEFRKAGELGANALTLSGTTVVFTDELVELADNDEELLAVYFHEIGHAELRHVEQSILQNSAWVVLFSVMVGDFSGAGELVVSLPLVVGQMAYSRELEREADQFAIDALLDAGLDPGYLADILEKLAYSHAAAEDEDGIESCQNPDASNAPDAAAESTEGHEATLPEASAERNWAERVFEYLSTHPATEERLQHIRSFSRS